MLGFGGHSSPSPAATPSASASCGAPAPSTAASSATATRTVRDPWGRPLDDTVVLVLANWTYAGPGYAPRSLGAELALASADQARAR